MDIEQERKDRFRFLRALWEASGANEYEWASMWELGESLQFDRVKTDRVYQYLRGEGMVEAHALGGIIGITHYGIREVEEAIANPEEPTHYFPAVNVISIGTMSNSTIQQSSPGAFQTVHLEIAGVEALETLLADIAARLDELGLEHDDRAQVEAEIATVRAQAAAPQPKTSIITECLASVRTLLGKAVTSAVASVLVAQITQFIATWAAQRQV